MTSEYYVACYKDKATDTDGYLFLQSKGRANRSIVCTIHRTVKQRHED